ncbi:hypothetical protein MIS45_06525 [Wielerella bovis]|uniref:calcium-binding protein n=1 Tax=Wielerella bovis TaxID=2917790 RepID=UPI002019DF21|nr:calcium-binding protein [Wielerella bovis]ULJ68462.1 hypothetical protein MIS45_06525 [Wielerella bovis]
MYRLFNSTPIARDRMAVLDAFTGQDSSRLFLFSEDDAKKVLKITNDTYASLTDNIYKGLLFQTRLQPYLNEIAFKIEDEQFALDFSRVIATFNQVHEDNPQKAMVDLAELMGYGKFELKQTGLPELLATYFALADESTLADVVPMLDKKVMETLDLHFANVEQANVSGSSKNDFLIGDKADNILNGSSGDDFLIGGAGNDTLNGGAGSDTYVFAKGHGQDVIKDYGSESNVLVFSNVSLSEINLYKQGSNLLLSHKDSQDTVLVNNFFSSTYYQVEKLVFEDQTVNLNATELNRVLSGANNMVNAMNAFGADMVSATNWQSDELKHIPTLLAVSV